MTMYRVTWEIDIDATSPYLAAMEALAIQRDPQSIATVFSVKEGSGVATSIDLDEPDEPDATLTKQHTIPEGRLNYWGNPDEVCEVIPGVIWVTTPSHGGLVLSDECNAKMPDYMRRADAVYEEDCNWCLPIIALDIAGEFAETLNQRPERIMADAKRTLHAWHQEKEEIAMKLAALSPNDPLRNSRANSIRKYGAD